MNQVTFGAFWAESVYVILAYSSWHMIKETLEAQPAKTSIIVGTIFSSFIDSCIDVPIDARFTFLALTLLEEIFAGWDLIFLVDV